MKLPKNMRVLERGWLSSNNIVFIDNERTAVVDTGYVKHAEQTLALIQDLLKGRPLDAIYNTHLHSDHCGGNRILQEHYPKVHTAIPAAELQRVQRWDKRTLSFDATGQRCDPFRADEGVKPDQVVRLGGMDWKVLFAPGHHPYSYVLFCEQHGILISADALWEKGFGVIFPALESYAGFRETRDTLDMIEALDVRLVIPGHGRPFTEVQDAIEAAHSRIRYLEADPLRNAQNGIKVLFKFLLMDKQRIKLSDVPNLISKVPLIQSANRRHMNFGDIHLSHWVITQLKRVNAVKIEGNELVNVEPA
jgi:glyoxylase-like metal-dependent hydrolase (beta-lactamase superfamily II)